MIEWSYSQSLGLLSNCSQEDALAFARCSLGGVVLPSRSCAVVGPQVTCFPFKYQEHNTQCRKIKRVLFKTLKQVYKDGVRRYIACATLGVGLWTAEAVLQMKRDGYLNIELVIEAPYQDNHTKWDETKKRRFEGLMRKCDSYRVCQKSYSPDCFQLCEYRMVEESDVVVCFYSWESGEGVQSVEHSQRMGRQLITIDPFTAVAQWVSPPECTEHKKRVPHA